MNKRKLAALETRRKLLDAAKKIVCEKGMANTSIADITNSCGVACGTFIPILNAKKTSSTPSAARCIKKF